MSPDSIHCLTLFTRNWPKYIRLFYCVLLCGGLISWGSAAADRHKQVIEHVVDVSVRGNEMANSGHYQAAIDLFTEAIKLDSKDFR